MDIKYSKCSYCNVNIVIGLNEEIEGFKQGVIPVWIKDKNTGQSIPNLISEKPLCIDCAIENDELIRQ